MTELGKGGLLVARELGGHHLMLEAVMPSRGCPVTVIVIVIFVSTAKVSRAFVFVGKAMLHEYVSKAVRPTLSSFACLSICM